MKEAQAPEMFLAVLWGENEALGWSFCSCMGQDVKLKTPPAIPWIILFESVVRIFWLELFLLLLSAPNGRVFCNHPAAYYWMTEASQWGQVQALLVTPIRCCKTQQLILYRSGTKPEKQSFNKESDSYTVSVCWKHFNVEHEEISKAQRPSVHLLALWAWNVTQTPFYLNSCDDDGNIVLELKFFELTSITMVS